MSSGYNPRFFWPESGYVEAPDWNPGRFCGYGLHGWLWGEGDGDLGDFSEDAKWLVVEVDAKKVVKLDGKVKFPSGNVVFCGSRKDATDYLVERAPGRVVVGAEVTVGEGEVARVGYEGQATAGNHGTAVAGDFGVARAGDFGVARAGEEGLAFVGDNGTAMVGDHGKATAGNNGKAVAGSGGIAVVRDRGTARAGYRGRVAAGTGGKLCLKHWRSGNNRTATVGKRGILPGFLYELDCNGSFVRVEGENV